MKLIDETRLDALAQQAGQNPRGRAHLQLHAGDTDPVQRFFVAADRRSYFRPHRHHTKSELTVILRGSFDLLVFTDEGRLQSRVRLGAGGVLVYEAPRITWHTLLVREEGSIFLEVKEGPYEAATAAEFALWSPAEGHPTVPRFQDWLRTAAPGEPYGGARGVEAE